MHEAQKFMRSFQLHFDAEIQTAQWNTRFSQCKSRLTANNLRLYQFQRQ